MKSMKKTSIIGALLITALLQGGCAKDQPANVNSANSAQAPPSDSRSETASSVMPLEEIVKPWKGDFDGMAERRIVRALVVYSRMLYFLDGAEQHGVTYEVLKEFENVINTQLGTKALKVHVAFIPVTRDQLQPALEEGRGDIAAANLTKHHADRLGAILRPSYDRHSGACRDRRFGGTNSQPR